MAVRTGRLGVENGLHSPRHDGADLHGACRELFTIYLKEAVTYKGRAGHLHTAWQLLESNGLEVAKGNWEAWNQHRTYQQRRRQAAKKARLLKGRTQTRTSAISRV